MASGREALAPLNNISPYLDLTDNTQPWMSYIVTWRYPFNIEYTPS